MAFEDLQTDIALLFEQMVEQPEDKHELAERIREMLSEMRATGMPVPEDLVELERALEAEFGEATVSPETVRPSPEAEELDDPLLESPGPPPE